VLLKLLGFALPIAVAAGLWARYTSIWFIGRFHPESPSKFALMMLLTMAFPLSAMLLYIRSAAFKRLMAELKEQ
jgi:hypothetical protein